MQRIIPMLGRKFGRFTVVDGPIRINTRLHWKCICDCGAECTPNGMKLRDGESKSCGCLRDELARVSNTVHGMAAPGIKRSPEYRAWSHIKTRCFNPKAPCWDNYGGRGITMHPEWVNDFPAFFEHIGRRPSASHSIDRINNDGNYEPGNIRWATRKEQNNNQRNTIHCSDGRSIHIAAEAAGVPFTLVRYAIYEKKLSPDKAIEYAILAQARK